MFTSKVRAHARSNIVAYVALFFALSGGAYAMTTAAKNSVVTKSIKNGAVTTSKLANGAVTSSKFAASAVAPDSTRLGGIGAGAYQLALTGACSANQAIASIGATGQVTCITPVIPISATPSAGNNVFLGPVPGLQIAVVCHDGGRVSVIFQNLGSSSATLNWLYSDGTTTAANGAVVAASGEQEFPYIGKRIEGQFIWSQGASITTVNLHAYDGGGFCEVRGTAEHATT
jgi:hypothetical protein